MHVLVPTLAVTVTWVLVALLLSGLGAAVGRAVAAVSHLGGFWSLRIRLWLGLAVLLGYLQLWNLFLPVDWVAWAMPVTVAAGGAALEVRRRPSLRLSPRTAVAAGAAALAVLWLADHALEPAADYDLGLYHLGIIEYAKRFGTIPGLANLQTRFGASDPHLLLVAFLDRGPWSGAGWHLVDGLLVALLVLELAVRLGRREGPSFTRRLALVLVPATVVVVGGDPSYRLSSPNLDLACFVLVAVGLLYLADCVEHGFRLPEAVASMATLGAASATRPLFWLTTAVAAAVLVWIAPRATRVRHGVGLAALPAVLLAGWMARQAILSGYPLYPVTAVGLPVDWRVPVSVVDYAGRWTSSWARWPGLGPVQVLASWHWLRGYWLPAEETSLDVIAPLGLLACLLPALALRRGDPGRAGRLRPMLAVALPCAATLAIWFFEAPDPRFVLAPLWLLPGALAAWAVPVGGGRRAAVLAGGIAAGIGLAWLAIDETAWFLPVVLAVPAYFFVLFRVVRQAGWVAPLARAAVLAAATAGVAVVAYHQPLRPYSANAGGPFGAPTEEVPSTVRLTTTGGLRLLEPLSAATGNDQCFAVLVCTAALADPALHGVLSPLHLRGQGVGSGFSVDPRAVRTATRP